jgi:hypothetical protein
MKLDVFAPLDRRERALHRAAYRRHFFSRNGPFDSRTLTFERREAHLRRLLDVAPAARGSETIDAAVFRARYSRFEPHQPASGVLLLLLAIVKLQVVPLAPCTHWFDQLVSRAPPEVDDTKLLVLAEEALDFHLLNSSTRLFALSPPGARRLGGAARTALHGVPCGPGFVGRPLQFARRLLDVVSLLELLRTSRDILRGKPHLLEPLEERLLEVLVDRVGHVSFSRTELGAAELARARALLPALTLALFEERREMLTIGAFALFPSTDVIRYQLSDLLPDAVRRRAYLVATD